MTKKTQTVTRDLVRQINERDDFQAREFTVDLGTLDVENRTVEVAASSEHPVKRWYGFEILDHSAGSIRMDRMQNGAAVLDSHEHRHQVGAVLEFRLDNDKRTRAKLKYSQSERGKEIFQDIVDGIRSHVSIGYIIHDMVLESRSDETDDTYRVMDWEPYEISNVSIPADPTIGVGRSFNSKGDNVMPEKDEAVPADKGNPGQRSVDNPPVAAVLQVDTDEITRKERTRIADVLALGDKFNQRELGQRAVNEGWSVAQMNAAIIERMNPEALSAGGTRTDESDLPSNLGLTDKEKRNYSMMNAIRAAVTGNWDKASFELECSRAIAEELGRDARGFFLPFDIQTRVMNATTGAGLIGTDHLDGSFIDVLRDNAIVIRAGATVLQGLVGNVDIPKLSGGATFHWLADDADVTDSDGTIGSVSLSPKTVAGSVPMSRRLLKQSSPAVEGMILRDLALGAGLAIDLAALEGTGAANQPTGIVSTSGVNTQSIAASAGTGYPTWAELVGFETAVAADKALRGSLRYVTTAAIRGGLKTTAKDSGSGRFLLENGEANGYMVENSEALTAKRIIFGNFNDVIIGMWGVLDIKPDEAAKAASGGLVLRVFQDADIAVRHPESFCINA